MCLKHPKAMGPLNWQERSALQSVAIRRSTGNEVSGLLFSQFFFFLVQVFLRRDLFSWKECSDQKTYFANDDGSAQKPRGRPLSRPRRPFWGPLAAILDFAGCSVFLIEGVL